MTTLEAMSRWGGGFVRALAECYRHADPENAARLYLAFEEVFKEYERRAQNWDGREYFIEDTTEEPVDLVKGPLDDD